MKVTETPELLLLLLSQQMAACTIHQ